MDRFIRNCIRDLTPYAVGCREGSLLLDANENSQELPSFLVEEVLTQLRKVNRYPDDGENLKAKLKGFLGQGICEDNLILTNGSDGGINLIANTFLNPGDEFLTVEPTFSMYKFYCSLAGGTHQRIMSLADYSYPLQEVKKKLLGAKPPKLLFVCSPNNPTGGTLSLSMIEEIMDCAQDTVVVVDHAYIEFGGDSALPLLGKFSNLIVLRTFSKAMGLAGLRIGYCIAQGETIALMKKALPPFLVSSLALALGEIILDNPSLVSERIAEIVRQRQIVFNELSGLPGLKVYPSHGNFLFVRAQDPHLGEMLRARRILVRVLAEGWLRISIGEKQENRRLLEAIANG